MHLTLHTPGFIPPTPLKRGGRGCGLACLTDRMEYMWCVSFPLLRGVGGMKNTSGSFHTPDPFKKGRSRLRVGAGLIDSIVLS